MDKKWQEIIERESKKDYFIHLNDYLNKQSKNKNIFPPINEIYRAFKLTPFNDVKVVIIGQDPYHQVNVANGLAFSVNRQQKIPKSLQNIFKELNNDLGINNVIGDLTVWAKQGVFLLNTILTVEEGKALSHKNKGWEVFTGEIINEITKKDRPIVFVLWGNRAKQFSKLVVKKNHLVVMSAHPSPLSAYNGFFGSKPFSKINRFLLENNLTPINWKIE
jgi:uracil-DNA glycosylase